MPQERFRSLQIFEDTVSSPNVFGWFFLSLLVWLRLLSFMFTYLVREITDPPEYCNQLSCSSMTQNQGSQFYGLNTNFLKGKILHPLTRSRIVYYFSAEYEDTPSKDSTSVSPIISDLLKRSSSFHWSKKSHSSFSSFKKKLQEATSEIRNVGW